MITVAGRKRNNLISRLLFFFCIIPRHQATKGYQDREKNAGNQGEVLVSLWLGVRKIKKPNRRDALRFPSYAGSVVRKDFCDFPTGRNRFFPIGKFGSNSDGTDSDVICRMKSRRGYP